MQIAAPISIHALLAESDSLGVLTVSGNDISIHALLAESDLTMTIICLSAILFLSTLSLRRATGIMVFCGPQGSDFYPRSPCGERRWLRCWKLAARDISIHALLAESDRISQRDKLQDSNFYPRSPCGERLRQRRIELGKFRFLSTLSLRRATVA